MFCVHSGSLLLCAIRSYCTTHGYALRSEFCAAVTGSVLFKLLLWSSYHCPSRRLPKYILGIFLPALLVSPCFRFWVIDLFWWHVLDIFNIATLIRTLDLFTIDCAWHSIREFNLILLLPWYWLHKSGLCVTNGSPLCLPHIQCICIQMHRFVSYYSKLWCCPNFPMVHLLYNFKKAQS